MATTTTNFGFDIPTSSDLVKNGATAIGTLGQDIDTFLAGGVGFAAGKNLFLNADFSIWQRGTSFSNPSNQAFTADRWSMYYDGSGATRTISQQTFTGDNPSGCNASYYLRFAQTVAGSGATIANAIYNKIENVRNFSGRVVTVSFWAKADASRTITLQTYQEFGSGGSGAVLANTLTANATTSWTRFSATFTMPSVSGKTITSNSSISHILGFPLNAVGTFDVTGFQLEAGSTATPFQTATGTIQGELAACQRYYYRNTAGVAYANFATGFVTSTSSASFAIPFPVTMRIAPTSVETSGTASNYAVLNTGGTIAACSAVTYDSNTTKDQGILAPTASSLTTGQGTQLRANNSVTAYIGWSAEL